MELTENQLESITQFAESYLELDEIAEVMEFDVDWFREEFENIDSTIRKAVRKGRLKTKAAIQNSLLTSAKNGSNPAQEKMLQIITKVYNQEK